MTHPAPGTQGVPGSPAPAAPPNGQPPQGGAGSYVWQPAAPAPGTQGAPTGGGANPGTRGRYEQYADASQRFLERYGPERAVDMLMRENADYREEIRVRDEQLRARPELPAGAVVLTDKAVIDEYNAFRALNLPAAQIDARLKNETRLAEVESARTRGTVAQQAAAALGWGGAAVLGDLVTDKGITIEMRDTTVTDGKGASKVQPMPFARKASDTNGHWTPLKEYVQQHHAGYLPALTVAAQGAGGGAAGTGGAPGTPGAQGAPAQGAPSGQGTANQPAAQGGAAVVVFGEPPANGGGAAAPTDPVARILAANEAAANAANALRPAVAATR